MAIIAIDGFELPDTNSIGGSGMTFDTTIVRSGARSLKLIASSTAVTTYTLNTAGLTPAYARVYIRVTSLPSGGLPRTIIGSTGSGGRIELNTDGTLTYRLNDNTAVGTTTTALTDTTKWYRIGYRWSTTGSSVTLIEIDGSAEVTGTPDASDMLGSLGTGDNIAGTFTIYFDDWAADDTALLGEGKVILLVPISDNNRGAWTGGVGGTTNLFTAVDNIPPLGTAAETDLTQIESAANSATDNCDLNLQTYTTGGVGASDTVNAVQAVCYHGEDINTGTKSGALTIVSNPAQSGGEVTFTYGNDNGALGTWPAITWGFKQGTATSGAGVAKGTSPVIRIGKRTATTRVVSCCFLGLYVDYTPAAAAAFGFPFPRNDRRIVPLI